MTVAILSLAGSVITFLFWLWKRKAASNDDKFTQHSKRVQEAEQAVAKGDADAFNSGLADDLQWLRAHGESNPSRQGFSQDARGKGVHPVD
jgi:hypothetical protein